MNLRVPWLFREKGKGDIRANRVALAFGILLVVFVAVAKYLGVEGRIIALVVLVVGWLSQAFAFLLALLALIPVVGPLIVSVVTLPFFLVVNGLAYVITLVSVRKGYVRSAIESRILVAALLVGMVMGYVLGKLV
jgi:hypothetical protein